MNPAARKTVPAHVSRVPAGRLERFLRLGFAAGGMAAGAAIESARRWWSGETTSVGDALLHPANARRLAKSLARMRGAAMKMGQLLSLEGGSLLPPQFSEVLTVLQDSAHTMSQSELNALLGREYGRGWQRRFRELDPRPIASASIGQVHRAVTVDGRTLEIGRASCRERVYVLV